jgi:hypothetical protein
MLLGGLLGIYAAWVNHSHKALPFWEGLLPGERSHTVDGLVLAAVIVTFCGIGMRPLTLSTAWQAIFVYLPVGLWALTEPGRTRADKIAIPLLWTLVIVGIPTLVVLLLMDLWQRYIVYYIPTVGATALVVLIVGICLRWRRDETARWVGTVLIFGALAVLATILVAFLLPMELSER